MATTTVPPLTLCEVSALALPAHETYSPFCMKVHRALRLAGLPYTRRHGRVPSDHQQHNPTGQVPVLLVGDEAVSDSTAILQRIDALAPGRIAGLASARERAEAWLWEELGDAALSGYLVAARWADPRNWPAFRAALFGDAPWPVRALIAPRVRARVLQSLHARDVYRAGDAACWARFERALDQLEARAPASGFWLGDAVSVADLSLFAQLHGLRIASVTPWQAAQIAARPRLTGYLDRVHAATWEPALRAASATNGSAATA